MFLVRGFRAHQREPVSIHLVNVDMTPEQRFVELCLDGVMYYWLPCEKRENSDLSKLNGKVLGMEFFIVLLKTQG